MSYLIDRRENPKQKSAVNRRRFMQRYNKQIKRAVAEAVKERSITDIERSKDVHIPADDVSEPVIHHGAGGRQTQVLPGNREFVTGDRIARPTGGSGGSGDGQASDQGEGDDDFVFQISGDELLDYVFDDLALPNLTKQQLRGTQSTHLQHAGFTNDGVPAKLNIKRTVYSAKMRHVALNRKRRREVDELRALLCQAHYQGDELAVLRIKREIEQLQAKIKRVSFLDESDLRYNLHVPVPRPVSQAVMVCVMDVSGSMDQATKDIAKRFFLLLHLFLKRHYRKTELVFIRHHTSAKEVDEHDFFYSRETGGTVVSSALHLTQEILNSRYPEQDWNIYVAQASDGDNWNNDSDVCRDILLEGLMPQLQYFAYLEITKRDHQALWQAYADVQAAYPETFAQQQVTGADQIFRVFRHLFRKREAVS